MPTGWLAESLRGASGWLQGGRKLLTRRGFSRFNVQGSSTLRSAATENGRFRVRLRAAEGRLDVRSLLLSRLRAFAVNSCSCVAPPSPCPSLIEVQGSRFSVRCPTINSPNYQPRQRQPHGLAVPNRDRRHERPALFRDSKLSCYPFPSGPNYLQAEHDDAHDDDQAVPIT